MDVQNIVKPPFPGPGDNPFCVGERRSLDKYVVVKRASQAVMTNCRMVIHPICCHGTLEDIAYKNHLS
jgi:hypothetical protein